MNAIVDEAACDPQPESVDPTAWTAIIPAAGRGSRLGYAQPKILFPILGRPILDWLLDALRPTCRRYVFVLSPDGHASVEPIVKKRLGGAAVVVIQERAIGMGDAVMCAEAFVHTPNALVVWGDQITLSRRTVLRCAALHEGRPEARLTLPTILRRKPYIHLCRDAEGRILEVLQAREKAIPHETGESDCGLFLFSTSVLFSTLRSVRERGNGIGAVTGEFNLLQALPEFESSPGSVLTMRISDSDETLGVNTVEDARQAENVLLRRRLQSDG